MGWWVSVVGLAGAAAFEEEGGGADGEDAEGGGFGFWVGGGFIDEEVVHAEAVDFVADAVIGGVDVGQFVARGSAAAGVGVGSEDEVVEVEGGVIDLGDDDFGDVAEATGGPVCVNDVIARAVVVADLGSEGLIGAGG